MTEGRRVVVLGAGVSGLTTALLLSDDPTVAVTVVAKHMPGDYDIEYASPWAGANYLPQASAGTSNELYERETWPELLRLARDLPEAGVHFQNTICYKCEEDPQGVKSVWPEIRTSKEPWFADLFPDFRVVPSSELPKGFVHATTFRSVCINTALYLPWLASQCLKRGVVFRRGIVNHVKDTVPLHHSGQNATVVVNCTGLFSARLGGVEDSTVHPIRGQIVVVRNDPEIMCDTSSSEDGPEEMTYIMHRAAGGGCVLGGSYQKNNWESQPDPSLALRIMKRSVDLCPALTKGKGIEALSIVRHGVGLRPARTGGIRVDLERIAGSHVVHNYGHGGAGYQASYGSAKAAVKLVHEALANPMRTARL